jgi:hypothetical protein
MRKAQRERWHNKDKFEKDFIFPLYSRMNLCGPEEVYKAALAMEDSIKIKMKIYKPQRSSVNLKMSSDLN